MIEIKITSEFIKLDQLLKLADVVSTGGEAKLLIKDEKVFVNGNLETQRGKKIRSGDIVKVNGKTIKVV
ncbi:ribosome-associated protein [Alkalithermobacter thermoalcaliphilus JW-YL-7 = DSM 7308]|uniref:Ribosome-associated protein n=1 Tax=Alkalithermobacter thermoalcaliphilus JW-YL-7 = DSM 7308 TaxID=1121328 RepID=A0A150FT31_CLOPD|nr:S4 domain protein YaaA [[Clostridium] paradoxum JW-YL-7 = DSM 7308]SHL08414.1 ribosome-associated protein [[Clostridium] paradoxum JW-YL-7 = DSM 7308]